MIKILLIAPSKKPNSEAPYAVYQEAWFPAVPRRGDSIQVGNSTFGIAKPLDAVLYEVVEILYSQTPDDTFEVTAKLKWVSQIGSP